MLVYALIIWHEQTKLDLWPFDLLHATFLWNHIPKIVSGLSPLDIISHIQVSSYHSSMLCLTNCFQQLPSLLAKILNWRSGHNFGSCIPVFLTSLGDSIFTREQINHIQSVRRIPNSTNSCEYGITKNDT